MFSGPLSRFLRATTISEPATSRPICTWRGSSFGRLARATLSGPRRAQGLLILRIEPAPVKHDRQPSARHGADRPTANLERQRKSVHREPNPRIRLAATADLHAALFHLA